MGLEPITHKNVICCVCLSLSYIYIIQYFFIKIKKDFLVPKAGLEPARPCGHLILSQARLPIPPLGHNITDHPQA